MAELLSQKNLFIITYPRTASSLFMRILALSEQPNTFSDENCGYFFLPAMECMRKYNLMERPYSEWTDDERTELYDKYQACLDKFYEHTKDAQAAGKTIVVKEHCPFMIEPVSLMKFLSTPDHLPVTDQPWKVKLPASFDRVATFDSKDPSCKNSTIFSDAFMMSWLPTFLIRHPIAVFPSYYRVFHSRRKGDAEQMRQVRGQIHCRMTLKWTRDLYDWYNGIFHLLDPEKYHQGPIIIDADDILSSPEVMRKYCQLVGLDKSKLQFSWDPLTQDEVSKHPPVWRRMRETLFASSGIQADKIAANLELETEFIKWKEEFGDDQGLYLRNLVVAAMPDYEYLRSRRLSL